MKTIQFFFLSFLLIISLTISFTSCTKEQTEVLIEEVCDEEKKRQHLFAFFDPFNQTIYYSQDYAGEIRESLNLEILPPSNSGSTDTLYAYPAFTVAGEPININVDLKKVEHEALLDIALNVDTEIESLLKTGVPAEELIASSSSRDGYYCKKVGNSRTTRCHVFPGYSNNSYHKDRYVCWEGNTSDECTEWKAKIGEKYTYYNQNCGGSPDATSDITGFTCQ